MVLPKTADKTSSTLSLGEITLFFLGDTFFRGEIFFFPGEDLLGDVHTAFIVIG